ncbi:MAG: hypothetical protein P1U65_08120 [Minwuia sp.]|nr:hypothetical protein [Minwuia sp.]
MPDNKTNTARIVPTRFSQMAKQKPAMSRNDAILAGQSAVTELEPEYLEWTDGLLRELWAAVDASAGHEAFPNPNGEKAYDLANQIRNLGATFEYDAVTHVADSFCELMHRLTEARRNDPHAMQTHLKALRLVSTPDFKRDGSGDLTPLMDALRQLVDHYPEPTGSAA